MVRTSEYDEQLLAINSGRRLLDVKLPTKFTEHVRADGSVKVTYHTPDVPARKMRRARRILWQLRNKPGGYRLSEYYKHPELRGVPYMALKKLWIESESDK